MNKHELLIAVSKTAAQLNRDFYTNPIYYSLYINHEWVKFKCLANCTTDSDTPNMDSLLLADSNIVHVSDTAGTLTDMIHYNHSAISTDKVYPFLEDANVPMDNDTLKVFLLKSSFKLPAAKLWNLDDYEYTHPYMIAGVTADTDGVVVVLDNMDN